MATFIIKSNRFIINMKMVEEISLNQVSPEDAPDGYAVVIRMGSGEERAVLVGTNVAAGEILIDRIYRWMATGAASAADAYSLCAEGHAHAFLIERELANITG